MTTIHAQAERKRQDRSVCRAEKRLCRARMLRVRGLIHPTSAVCATTDTARGEKRLPSEQNQAILKSSGRSLGECRILPAQVSDSRSATCTRESVIPIRLRSDFSVFFESYAGGAEHWLGHQVGRKRSLQGDNRRT